MEVEDIIDLFDKHTHGDGNKSFDVIRETSTIGGKKEPKITIRFSKGNDPEYIYSDLYNLTNYVVMKIAFKKNGWNAIHFKIRKGNVLFYKEGWVNDIPLEYSMDFESKYFAIIICNVKSKWWYYIGNVLGYVSGVSSGL